MAWQDAVEPVEGGCTLRLDVTPGAKRSVFPDGFNEWRGRIRIAVLAAAQDGAANEDVVGAVAAFFHVPRASVTIRSGAADRRKRVQVSGVSKGAALERLERVL